MTQRPVADTVRRWRGFLATFAILAAGCLALIDLSPPSESPSLPGLALILALLAVVAALLAPNLRGLAGAVAGAWTMLVGAAVASIATASDPDTMADAALGVLIFGVLVPVVVGPGFAAGAMLRRGPPLRPSASRPPRGRPARRP